MTAATIFINYGLTRQWTTRAHIFKTLADPLETAQRQKTDYILRKLQLKPGATVLDIGSGWGFLLVEAAKKYNITGVGVTLSKEQVAYAQDLAKREGVDDLVTFRYMNYQDIPKDQMFDRIVSVGFFEHVGRNNLAEYFKVVDRHLKPRSISVLHSISHREESPSDPWIDKYIFPGGYIPKCPWNDKPYIWVWIFPVWLRKPGATLWQDHEHWRKNCKKIKIKL